MIKLHDKMLIYFLHATNKYNNDKYVEFIAKSITYLGGDLNFPPEITSRWEFLTSRGDYFWLNVIEVMTAINTKISTLYLITFSGQWILLNPRGFVDYV